MGTFQGLPGCRRLIYVAIKKLSDDRRSVVPYSPWPSGTDKDLGSQSPWSPVPWTPGAETEPTVKSSSLSPLNGTPLPTISTPVVQTTQKSLLAICCG